jgi:hypothetical protein
MKTKSLIFMTILLSGVLLSPMLLIGITSSQFPTEPPGAYSVWGDLNDDGKIDILDIVWLAGRYGTTGTPVNKTELLYNVNATLDEIRDQISSSQVQILPYDWLAKLTWEADEDGLQLISPSDFTNLYYGVKTENLDSTNSTTFADGLDSNGDCIYFAKSVDEFAGPSVNQSIWTLGYSGEAALPYIRDGKLYMGSSSNAGHPTNELWSWANGSLAPDYALGTKDKEILIKIDGYLHVPSGYSGNPFIRISLGDSSSVVELLRWSGNAGYFEAYIKVEILGYPVARANVYVNGALARQNIDLISLSHWYLQFFTHADGGTPNTAELNVHHVRCVVGDSHQTAFFSKEQTTDSNITAVLFFAKRENNGGSFIYQISADNGLHYETIIPGELHTLTYPGNTLIVKIIGVEPSTPDGTKENNTPTLSAWAVVWNPS